MWRAESRGVVGFLLSRQFFEKIGFQNFIRKTRMFSFRHTFRWPTNFNVFVTGELSTVPYRI